ncbi:transcriptional regulator PadR-like family protein [mine drainage metagenome]|uniref:Transcriptional regulator PadR-like family protein n=1 Tax=mine drainage metagenome TaxID=410659 RepID=A0A1J5R257_9ZZZZ
MTEQAYLVLLALVDHPRHGYGIVQEVLTLSAGSMRLGAGTLYGLLDRLGAEGLVEPSGEEVVDGRLRRYYRLTEAGAAAVTTETARLGALARRARLALGRSRANRPALGGA